MVDLTRRGFICTTLGAAALSAVPKRALARAPRVRTIAGTGIAGYEPEGRAGLPGITTPVNNPYGIVLGPDGALYFCEVDTGRTRRFDIDSGRLTTVAGTGEAGFSGDGGAATAAQFRQPHSIAFDDRGGLLVCDIGNGRLRRIDMSDGTVVTLSGTGERTPTPDEGPLAGTALRGPRSIDTDAEGNAYLVLREGNAVFRLNLRAGRLQRIAGTGETGYTGDGGPAALATFNGPKGIAYSSADRSLYIVDTENHVIRRMSLESGLIETVLGTGERGDGPDGDPLECRLARPHGICVHQGVVYVTDSESHRVRALEDIV